MSNHFDFEYQYWYTKWLLLCVGLFALSMAVTIGMVGIDGTLKFFTAGASTAITVGLGIAAGLLLAAAVCFPVPDDTDPEEVNKTDTSLGKKDEMQFFYEMGYILYQALRKGTKILKGTDWIGVALTILGWIFVFVGTLVIPDSDVDSFAFLSFIVCVITFAGFMISLWPDTNDCTATGLFWLEEVICASGFALSIVEMERAFNKAGIGD